MSYWYKHHFTGTLTGGSRPNTAPVLAQLHELRKAKDELAELEGKLAAIDAQLKKMSASAAEYVETLHLQPFTCNPHTFFRAQFEYCMESQSDIFKYFQLFYSCFHSIDCVYVRRV